jgi:hypothetical protein
MVNMGPIRTYTLQFVGCYTYDSWFCRHVFWWYDGCVRPHIRALTWRLLIYYATWISLSEFHDFTRSGHIFSHHLSPPYLVFQVQHILLSPYAFTSVDPGQYLCLSIPFPLSSSTYFPQCAYPFTVIISECYACMCISIHSFTLVWWSLLSYPNPCLAVWLTGCADSSSFTYRYCILWTHIQAYPSVVYHCGSRVVHVSIHSFSFMSSYIFT